jgi:hypothetical protein
LRGLASGGLAVVAAARLGERAERKKSHTVGPNRGPSADHPLMGIPGQNLGHVAQFGPAL